MFTKKQKFLPPEEWVMFKDETDEIVPAIVSEALWDQANASLRRRVWFSKRKVLLSTPAANIHSYIFRLWSN